MEVGFTDSVSHLNFNWKWWMVTSHSSSFLKTSVLFSSILNVREVSWIRCSKVWTRAARVVPCIYVPSGYFSVTLKLMQHQDWCTYALFLVLLCYVKGTPTFLPLVSFPQLWYEYHLTTLPQTWCALSSLSLECHGSSSRSSKTDEIIWNIQFITQTNLVIIKFSSLLIP